MLTRVVTFLVGVAFVLVATAGVSAVEKKEKKSKDQKEQPQAPSTDKKSPEAKEPEKKKYDDFVDKNKNGIDDRKENIKEKPAKK
jgi:hypothetical protein